MTNTPLALRSPRPRWFVPLVSGLATLASACISAATPLGAQALDPQRSVLAQAPHVPNKPELVTVVPFAWKPNETDPEQAIVAIPAEVDGYRGIFILDLGSTWFELNRTYLQRSSTGGVDSITNANRVPERDTSASTGVHVTVRIGTLTSRFEDTALKAPNGRPVNGVLNHMWNNFTVCGFVPRLGNIGPTVLEPFETIIDYRHRQVVLIRLDSAGRRLVDVPAYTPVWSAPLIDIPSGPDWGMYAASSFWGVRASLGGVSDTLAFDNGTQDIALSSKTMKRIAAHVANDGTLDSLTLAGRSFKNVPVEEYLMHDVDMIGYSFLHSLGVVGFNHRTHQFILYR
jgi:hypothetical protein